MGDMDAARESAADRLGGEIEPVDVYRPWSTTTEADSSGTVRDDDPDVRESTPAELAGRA